MSISESSASASEYKSMNTVGLCSACVVCHTHCEMLRKPHRLLCTCKEEKKKPQDAL